MNKENKNFERAMHDLYVEAYKSAEPSADFDELMKHPIIDRNGHKNLPYEDYVISSKLFDELIVKYLKKYRIPKRLRSSFIIGATLGPSPRVKED